MNKTLSNKRTKYGESLKELLGLDTNPVGIGFVDKRPQDLPRVTSPGPASCSYWKSATEGQIFYTEASDHYHCPIGAWTHHVELPSAVESELEGMVERMVALGYIRKEEVPHIPRRKQVFGFVVYGPLANLPEDPDVVLLRGSARQLMLMTEAATAAGAILEMAPRGRPTCAIIPLSIESGRVAVSFACIGNRIYTGAQDGEAYCAIPFTCLETVLRELKTVVCANSELEAFHRARLTMLNSANSDCAQVPRDQTILSGL